MSCRAFRRDWEPGGPDTHATSCGPCNEWLASRRELASRLARLSAQIAAAEPSARETELRAAFRGFHREATRRPPLAWFLSGAIAAGLVGLLVFVSSRPHAPAADQRAEAPAAPPTRVPTSAKPRPSGEPKRVVRHAPPRPAPLVPSEATPLPLGRPTPAATAVLSPPPAESSDDPSEPALRAVDATEPPPQRVTREQSFYPLLPDREPSALESGQIVRVQVRPDVLTAAGLSSRTSGTAPVEAEVLMGPDGVALGIRLPKPKR